MNLLVDSLTIGAAQGKSCRNPPRLLPTEGLELLLQRAVQRNLRRTGPCKGRRRPPQEGQGCNEQEQSGTRGFGHLSSEVNENSGQSLYHPGANNCPDALIHLETARKHAGAGLSTLQRSGRIITIMFLVPDHHLPEDQNYQHLRHHRQPLLYKHALQIVVLIRSSSSSSPSSPS